MSTFLKPNRLNVESNVIATWLCEQRISTRLYMTVLCALVISYKQTEMRRLSFCFISLCVHAIITISSRLFRSQSVYIVHAIVSAPLYWVDDWPLINTVLCVDVVFLMQIITKIVFSKNSSNIFVLPSQQKSDFRS